MSVRYKKNASSSPFAPFSPPRDSFLAAPWPANANFPLHLFEPCRPSPLLTRPRSQTPPTRFPSFVSLLSLFFFLPQTNVLRLVSYPPCRLLFYLKPEFPSVRARVQIYSKTVQLSRRSNTPVKIRAESSFRKFGNNAFPLLESLLGQRWGKFNNRGYE